MTALSAVASACTLLAPSDDELFGGMRPAQPGPGGQPGNGGASSGETGSGAGGAGRASAGDGGVSFGGRVGTGGSGGESGEGAAGTAAGEGGSGGGADPVCSLVCGPNERCTIAASGAECTCVDGLVRDGAACRLPRSCDELHRFAPALPSGTYPLQPVGATSSFPVHCGMALEGGGWTLVVNEGPSFDPTTMGLADAVCYSSGCTNAGYSTVLVNADVMIDVSNSPIFNAIYTARVIVTGVHATSRGKTLRTLFTTGPNYVEAEDNSNVAVRMIGGVECTTLPTDMSALVCNECATPGCKVPVMVFGDGDAPAGCRTTAVPRFAIGAATDHSTAWTNCAGWPQDPNYANFDFYPDYVRVWIR